MNDIPGFGSLSDLSQVYQSMQALLMSTALKIVKNHDQAEDMVHETFLRVLENSTLRGCPAERLILVLPKVCRNYSIDTVRRESKRPRIHEDYIQTNDPAQNSLDGMERENLIRQMKKSIDKLTKKEKELLNMRFYETLSSREIGERLGITAQAVDCRWHRLAKKLQEFGIGEPVSPVGHKSNRRDCHHAG
jgi:RNA polymerase sigma-70 factor (ECF subfamily)